VPVVSGLHLDRRSILSLKTYKLLSLHFLSLIGGAVVCKKILRVGRVLPKILGISDLVPSLKAFHM